MNSRIFFGALTANFMMAGLFVFGPTGLFEQASIGPQCFVFGEVTLACLSLVVFGRRLLAKPYGQLVFRSIFISHATAYAFCYSLITRSLFLRYGLNAFTISASTLILTGSTIAISTFSFDLLACALFLPAVAFPVIYSTTFELPGAMIITISYLGGFGFFSFMAWSLHNSEIGILTYQEQIAAQSEELTVANARLSNSNQIFDDTMNSIDEIILNIDLNGKIFGNTVTRYQEILGFEPNGRNFSEILRLVGDEQVAARDWFEMLASDRVSFEILAENGPANFQGEGNRSFHVNYFARRQNDTLSAVVMTISDVTREQQNRKSAEEAIARANFVLAAQENPVGLQRFLEDVASFFEAVSNLEGVPEADFKLRLHTFKGTAAMFFIVPIASEINALEMRLKSFGSSSVVVAGLIRAASDEILARLNTWKAAEAKTLDRLGIFSNDRLVYSRSQAELLRAHFNEAMTFDRALKLLGASDLERVLQGFAKVVARVALRTGKQVDFVVEPFAEHLLLMKPSLLEAADSLVHLFSNAVDHGIESPERRIAVGKPPNGRIQVRSQTRDDHVVITVADDGAGVDANRLREALTQKGVNALAFNDREIIRTILQAGISTKTVADEISGQGVGLSALDHQITALGGSVEIFTEVGKGTRFEIQIPLAAGILALSATQALPLAG